MVPRVKHNPALHTRSWLLRQIDGHLGHRARPLLIGSLGRAAAIGTEKEFVGRGETPEKTRWGLARDIDLFVPTGEPVSFPCDPFPVDTTALTAHDQRVVCENGDFWLVDDLVGSAVPVDADIFTPHSARLLGELDVQTVTPLTHFALLYVIYEDPKKYAFARRVLESHLTETRSAGLAELYRPFKEFHRLRQKSLLNQARRAYRCVVPFGMRNSLRPLIHELKTALPLPRRTQRRG